LISLQLVRSKFTEKFHDNIWFHVKRKHMQSVLHWFDHAVGTFKYISSCESYDISALASPNSPISSSIVVLVSKPSVYHTSNLFFGFPYNGSMSSRIIRSRSFSLMEASESSLLSSSLYIISYTSTLFPSSSRGYGGLSQYDPGVAISSKYNW